MQVSKVVSFISISSLNPSMHFPVVYVCLILLSMCASSCCLCVPHPAVYVYLILLSMCASFCCLCVPHSAAYVCLNLLSMCASSCCLCVPHSPLILFPFIWSPEKYLVRNKLKFYYAVLSSFLLCCFPVVSSNIQRSKDKGHPLTWHAWAGI